MRSFERTNCCKGQNFAGSFGNTSGSIASRPTLAENNKAVSATSRPIGPSTEITDHPSARALLPIMPGEGRIPTTPHKAAGMRNEPPVSDPVQIGKRSVASAAAEPPDEPPAFKLGLKGLPVAPHTGLRVFAPAPMSGVLVFAVTIAPAARRRVIKLASCVGTLLRKPTLP